MARVYPFTFPNSSKNQIIAKPHFMQEFAMRATALLLSLFVGLTASLHADDGAASIAAGGIIVMKRETRIVMAKEVLNISPSRVLVDYDFRNDSDEDVTTEVAFPVPDYKFDPMEFRPSDQSFDDFKLWVDGKPAEFRMQLRAVVNGRDITPLLRSLSVDPGSFGHWPEREHNMSAVPRDIASLSKAQRNELITAKALDNQEDLTPLWEIEKKYHWTQTFPAHTIVHIRHQYTPVLGNSNTIGDPADYQGKDAIPEYVESCPTPALRDTLSNVWNRPGAHDEVSPLWISYVSFILTTANTWKTPIEDFTLIVERPHDPKYKTYVSFCWDGPVTQIDPDHFSAHITGLVPTKELQIGFIHADTPKAK